MGIDRQMRSRNRSRDGARPCVEMGVGHIACMQTHQDIPELLAPASSLEAALVAENAGATGITVHLRSDRRHIQEKDVAEIRQAIDGNARRWKQVAHGGRFRKHFEPEGDSLKRPPRGFDPDHPLIDDLKRKDFIATTALTEKGVATPGFIQRVADGFGDGAPLVEFLCRSVDVPF